MPLISVIIPIYNVAPYLRECLESIIHQTYSHLEIILVNDGSTDGSEKIAREYLSDPRVRLISQENKGLSGARNTGMREARGEYLAFVDSDDYLSISYFQEMLSIALENKVDMVCNDGIVRFGKGSYKIPERQNPQKLVPDSQNIVFGGAVWRFLFAKTLIDRCGVEFLEGKIYEDEAFLYMIAPFCHSFARYSGESYYYRQRADSIMACHKNFRSYDLLDVFEAIYLYYENHQLLERFMPPYYFLYSCGIGYENEKEYLQRAKLLIQKLGICDCSHKLPIQMEKVIQSSMDEFQI